MYEIAAEGSVRKSAGLAGYLLLAMGVAGSATADASEITFRDKTVEMIVASDPGGGTDLVGRLFARYFEKYLPGRPAVVAKNMGSGAGKILAANYLARAKPDGMIVMQTDSDTLQPTLLKRSAVKYEPAEFRVVGAISRGGSIVFIRKDAVARLKDPSARPVVVGATSGQRSWQAMLVWGKEFLGWNVRWVKGYKGSGAMKLALQRGEIDVFATNGINVILSLHKEGLIDFLVQEGQAEGDSFGPRPSFKDVPIFPLLLKKVNIPEIAMRGYRSVMGASDVDKWLALPPKTPDDIVAVYRTAFHKATKDPQFLEAAHKQVSEEIYVADGARSERAIRELRSAPPEVTKYAEELRQKYNLLPK
jgi:tripartite-type tricarboxylate transporter receptor subunit TctC